MKPSMTISASAGTSRSTVLAFTTLIGAAPARPGDMQLGRSAPAIFLHRREGDDGRRAEHLHGAGQVLRSRGERSFSQWL